MQQPLSTVALHGLLEPYAVPTFASLSSDAWPSPSDWTALNNSVDGRLQVLRPWAAACYTSDPLYNIEECQSVLSGYRNDTQREAVPAALLWTNWESCGYGQGCALDYHHPRTMNNVTCHQGSTPPYSIPISRAQDASAIVQWAAAHNVKITVKNTGHDFLGRSASPSTLQVNTHLMNHLDYVPEFVPQGSDAAPVPALTMGAGAQIRDIYSYAVVHDFSPVIGACLTIGAAGGYLQGGGHGVLTPAYGLAADNALEFEVVTADGQIRVANEAQNSDLFWALRGGGGGSWGIVTSATIRVHPSVKIGASLLTVAPSASQDEDALGIQFISLAAKYQNSWGDVGITVSFVVAQDQYSLSLYWPVTTASLFDLYPFFEELKGLSSNYTVTSNTTSPAMFPTVRAAVEQNIAPFFDTVNHYGASNQLSSRLVPRSYIDPSRPASITAVAEAIWRGLQIVNKPFSTNAEGLFGPSAVFILGDMPYAAAASGAATGANPGLYAAAWHVIFTVPWTAAVCAKTRAAVMAAVHDAVAPLTALGITGSYQNEGDPFEREWQQAFFGHKYARLSAIKQTYDPDNFFMAFKGVASVTNLTAYECYAVQQRELVPFTREAASATGH